MARPRGTSRITAKGTQPTQTGKPTSSLGDTNHRPASSPLLGWSIMTCLAAGVFVIASNYLSWIPGSPSNIWIAIGLGIVLAGILLATRWR